ncbi:enoyl-CoA hydratase [Falsiroseomonas selenitidurans]|uniref:Enoyl-CoA hydratase n=1 Tax=Falsiroseomonas selenitidurans TaxID=2716335 RepID=A0ABX1E2D6_9PROT|nr:enoyl-CoA hydratase [Falsiroseomonas selenitidurans]NKC31256.1 enoyl-CoA hydratase [Falsiroseomonas selenitidurans]
MTGRMLSEKTGGIGWMTFSNPTKRNAMSLEMWGAMEAILADFQADPAIRVVVMQGDGDRAFVSGADISQFEKSRSDAESAAAYAAVSDSARAMLNAFDKPLIALIRGYCLGGGLGIAMAADIRFAASDARFGIPAANLGAAYSSDSLRRLVGLVGPAAAKDILFSARRLEAEEALRLGLVSRLCAPEALEAEVRAYATLLAQKAPLSLRASKAIVNELMKPESAQDAAMMRGHVETCFNSADYTEGRRAFMEKRSPVFQGR